MLFQGLEGVSATSIPPPTSQPRSSVVEMSQPPRSASTDSTSDSIRKRVCKACDRCRLKKSKCDGANPCSRCKADNAICVFGERKKSHDKVYPKGYVEMLEQQQGQLVSGLQEMYRRLLAGQSWNGPALSETSGHPLTHDILAALNLLETKHDGSGEVETFEEDCQKLQARLFKAGAPCMRRKGSFSSESEHSQHENHRPTPISTPNMAKVPVFKDDFSFSPSPSPIAQSPVPRQRQSYPPAKQSPLHQNCHMPNDPQLYQPEWDLSNPSAIMRSKYAMQPPQLQHNLDDVAEICGNDDWSEPNSQYDLNNLHGLSSYSQTLPNVFSNIPGVQDFGLSLDPMDIEFNRWVQVTS